MVVLTCEFKTVRCTAKRSMFFSTVANLGTNLRQERRSFDLYTCSLVCVAEKEITMAKKDGEWKRRRRG